MATPLRIVQIPDLPKGWKVEATGLDVCLRDEHNRPVVRARLNEDVSEYSPAGLLSFLWRELSTIAKEHHA